MVANVIPRVRGFIERRRRRIAGHCRAPSKTLADVCGAPDVLDAKPDRRGEAPMKTIAVLNAKGGCGKTTLSTHLAVALSRSGVATTG